MLAAVVLSALALTGPAGANSGLWWSDATPRAGTDYVAISWTGRSDFDCGGSIGNTSIAATAYRLADTTICVLRIPDGTAGKKLQIGWTLATRETTPYGLLITHVHGAPVKPKLIRR